MRIAPPPLFSSSSQDARSLLTARIVIRKTKMLDSAHIAELVRQFDEVEQAIIARSGNKEARKDLERHHEQLKKQIKRLQHEAAAHRLG